MELQKARRAGAGTRERVDSNCLQLQTNQRAEGVGRLDSFLKIHVAWCAERLCDERPFGLMKHFGVNSSTRTAKLSRLCGRDSRRPKRFIF
ncbi:MAG: hypothetical protein QOE55_545 [Acidobacteriaceae bacterium]|nr:hypothetical protein [Acidobacteriaceae bacterium]